MSRKTGKGRLAILLTAWVLTTWAVPAQSPTLRAYLDKTRIGLGERFVLSLEIGGSAARDHAEPSFPDMNPFARYQGRGSSQNVQIVNGRVSSKRTINFYFTAITEGNFEIGPIHVESGGRTLSSEPIQISIGTPVAPTGVPATRPPAAGDPELFVVATANQKSAFQNEAVVITYRIYTRLSVSSFKVARLPETSGFWVEDYTLPRSPATRTEIINGRRYTVATIKRMAVFPTAAGPGEIGPLEVECQVRVQRRTRSLFDDFFSRDLFGSTQPRTVKSNAVELEVLRLPQEGQPPGFEGAVGRFRVSSRVKAESKRANQAFSLRIVVEGEGNLQHLGEPKLDLPESFEMYPPETGQDLRHGPDGVSGKKSHEYIVIPRQPGTFELPSVEVPFFDPHDGTYRIARSKPITVDVAPGDDSQTADTGFLTRRELELVGQDIRFIKTGGGGFSRIPGRTGTAFWILLVIPLLSLGSSALLQRHRLRLQSDVAYARSRRASRVARKRLNRARLLLEADPAEFYAEVDRAVAGFVGDRLNLPDPSLTSQEIRKQLLAVNVSPDDIDEVLECRDVCDRNRFSPHPSTLQGKGRFLERVERCLTSLGNRSGRARSR